MKQTHPMIPTKKISLTLIDYADPLLQDLPPGYSKNDLQKMLKFAAGIWNACVVDQWQNSTENVTEMRRLMSSSEPIPAAIVEFMIERKQRLFGHDPRGITNEQVVIKNGEFVVRAEARLDDRHMAIAREVN